MLSLRRFVPFAAIVLPLLWLAIVRGPNTAYIEPSLIVTEIGAYSSEMGR